MKRIHNNSNFQYALIACLATALLFGQIFKLHMHVQHEDHPLNSSTEYSSDEHIVNVHVTSSEHDKIHLEHHQDDFLGHHNNVGVDIGSLELLKVSKLLNLFIFLIFVVSFVLYVPLLQRIYKKHVSEIKCCIRYYVV